MREREREGKMKNDETNRVEAVRVQHQIMGDESIVIT